MRRATAADSASEICRVVNAAYRREERDAGKSWTTEAHLVSGERLTLPQCESMLASNAIILLALRGGNKVIGTVQVTPTPPDCGFIGMLSVDPMVQAEGVGKTLLAAAEGYIRDELRFPFARMRAFEERSELVAYYVRRGYLDTGTRIKFDKPGASEVLLRGQLHFVLLEKKL